MIVVGLPVVALLFFASRAAPTPKAAMFGVASGLLFGLSATFSKATIEQS